MAKYRGGVIGLGWTGMLYDMAARPSPAIAQPRFDLLDTNRPTPTLDTGRKFPLHEMHTGDGMPTSYAEAMADRPDVDLVAAKSSDSQTPTEIDERIIGSVRRRGHDRFVQTRCPADPLNDVRESRPATDIGQDLAG